MEINDILKRLPPAPPKVDEWIRKNHVKNTYIIYNKKRTWRYAQDADINSEQAGST